jgi:hypothetical protein
MEEVQIAEKKTKRQCGIGGRVAGLTSRMPRAPLPTTKLTKKPTKNSKKTKASIAKKTEKQKSPQ